MSSSLTITPTRPYTPIVTRIATFERDKVKGAIRTDFILSAEIVAITLGIVAEAPLLNQILILSGIAILVTIGDGDNFRGQNKIGANRAFYFVTLKGQRIALRQRGETLLPPFRILFVFPRFQTWPPRCRSSPTWCWVLSSARWCWRALRR